MGKSISEVISKIQGGMSLSTMYEVTFNFNVAQSVGDGSLSGVLANAIGDSSSAWTGNGLITLMCNEAQLPNVSSLTGQTNGVFLGEGQVNYAYGRLFTDISLGWQCDRDMTPLKFLQRWHNFIYSRQMVGPSSSIENSITRNGVDKVRYPRQYQANIIIKKLSQSTKTKDDNVLQYTLIGAFPHSIDATPLSYGSSQVVNVSASFYYSKYFVTKVG